MEFKKCSRCGNFYVTEDDVCPNCKTKDALEFESFKSYVEKNGVQGNLYYMSNATGIAEKNVNRFMNYEGLTFKQSNKNNI